jgi:Rrf2 family protein
LSNLLILIDEARAIRPFSIVRGERDVRLELTRKADYAVRTVLLLARQGAAGWMAGPRIAEAMGIPPRFLPQVMQDLVRANIVEATLGRGGGYRLRRDPRDVSVLDIVEAIEGDARRRACVLRSGGCDAARPCDIHDVFAEAQDALLRRLGAASVQDLLDRDRERARTTEARAS